MTDADSHRARAPSTVGTDHGAPSTTARVPHAWRAHVVTQSYERYTDDDQALWRDLVADTERSLARHARAIHPAYIEGFRRLLLPWRSIPRLTDLDSILAEFGWRTVAVDGYIPPDVYAGLMTHGIFPVSRALRSREHIGFSPVPDMAHDLFGHVPMLVSAEYRGFLRRLARAMSLAEGNPWDAELFEANRAMASLRCQRACAESAIRAAEDRVGHVHLRLRSDPSRLTELGRMYLWSVEFGLLGDATSFVVYGAGLLSSMSELESVVHRRADVRPFSRDVFREDIQFSDPQRRYFVASDFTALHQELTDYEASRAG